MKHPKACTKFVCAGAAAMLAIFAAGNVTAACKVWWQQKCCQKAGVTSITCTSGSATWTCSPSLVSDPAVGSLSNADAGWNQLWIATFATCEYFAVACGGFPGSCLYIAPSQTVTCANVKPPTSPPNCDMCP